MGIASTYNVSTYSGLGGARLLTKKTKKPKATWLKPKLLVDAEYRVLSAPGSYVTRGKTYELDKRTKTETILIALLPAPNPETFVCHQPNGAQRRPRLSLD